MEPATDLIHQDSSDHEFFSTEGEDRNGADTDTLKRNDDTSILSLHNAFDLLKEINDLPSGEAKQAERNKCHSSDDDIFGDIGVVDNASKEGANLKKHKHSKGSSKLAKELLKANSLNSNKAQKGTELRTLRTPSLVPLPPAPHRKIDVVVSARLARDPIVDTQATCDELAPNFRTSIPLANKRSTAGPITENYTFAASTLNPLLHQKSHSSSTTVMPTPCTFTPASAAQKVTSPDVLIPNNDKSMKGTLSAVDSENINSAAPSINSTGIMITNPVQGRVSGLVKDTQGASAQAHNNASTDTLKSARKSTISECTTPVNYVGDLPIISHITFTDETLGPDKRKISKPATMSNTSEACRKSEMILSKFWAYDLDADQTTDSTGDPDADFDDFPPSDSDRYLVQPAEIQKKGKRRRPRKTPSGFKHKKSVVPLDTDNDFIHTRSKTNKKNTNT